MSIAEKLTTIAENEQKVYEAGKTKEWSDFWDSYQENGNRGNYQFAFAQRGWTDETFKPKYNINVTTALQMFQNCRITNLAQILKDYNVVLNITDCTNIQQMFQTTYVTHLPILDIRKVTSSSYAFQGSNRLESIEKLIVAETTVYGASCFASCSSLTHVIFEGTIGQNGLSLMSTKLDHDSIESIINALSGTTSGLSVTFSKTAVNNAFGIDVDDLSTWGEGTEFYNLRHSKDNWTISFTDV